MKSVLIAGEYNASLIIPLVRGLMDLSDDLEFGVVTDDELNDNGTTCREIKTFKQCHALSNQLIPKNTKARSQGIGGPRCSPHQQRATRIRPYLRYLGQSEFVLKQLLRSGKCRRHYRDIWSNYDLIHLQSLFIREAHMALISEPQKKPLVISVWGSDVLRSATLANFYFQQLLLVKADVITCSGPEMSELVLAKYGRSLKPKIVDTYFDVTISKYCSRDRGEARQTTTELFGIPKGRTVIMVGHNASYNNNHKGLIEALSQLPIEIKENVHVVLPMTYGGYDHYCGEIETMIKQSGLSHTMLTSFLPDEHNTLLRLSTDILLYAPVSDMFSASVSQALASGTAVVIGSWLPNKARSRAGFKYWEIDEPTGATSAVKDLVKNWHDVSMVCEANRSIAGEIFDSSRIATGWRTAYDKAWDL